jgi:hypothetical protein
MKWKEEALSRSVLGMTDDRKEIKQSDSAAGTVTRVKGTLLRALNRRGTKRATRA